MGGVMKNTTNPYINSTSQSGSKASPVSVIIPLVTALPVLLVFLMWVNALFKRRHKRNLSVRSHYSEQPPSAERNKMAEEDLCYVYVDFNRYPKGWRCHLCCTEVPGGQNRNSTKPRPQTGQKFRFL
ncbi:hypothetical protein XENTR_v10022689 [Xenopus tropicalis]|nr:hypothetical protein XENTR_v10022689 [Xenopus tropicalis]